MTEAKAEARHLRGGRHSEAEAFGWPGMPPRWTASQKEGVGTAYSAASCVWFTLSRGVLDEVYYPTVDRPQIRDLQFLVTDGATFFHEERRDLQREIECLRDDGDDLLAYRQVNTDPSGRYRIIKETIADPDRPCVLIHARFEIEREWRGRLRAFVLLAPHLGRGGWGNSGRRLRVNGGDVLLAWKGQECVALGANIGFLQTSCGYVGASDGWQDLHADLHMGWTFERAEDGNIALTGEVDLDRADEFTVGLAFGDHEHAAVTTLLQSLRIPFAAHRETFAEQWSRASSGTCDLSSCTGDGGHLYRLSHKLLIAHEDKVYPGARIASASIPWGDAKGDEDLGGYHLVWTRDMVQSASALLICGETENPCRALVYLACSQRSDGGFAQNFWLNGTPFWNGTQLDEVAFPVLLAWRLWKAACLGDFDPYPMVKAAAGFLIRHGPMTQQERWEEASGYSPSTLAATIAALICAADFARARNEVHTARFMEEYADFLESHLERWTVTKEGALLPGISRHYIRIHPTSLDDPAPSEDPDRGVLILANQPPGAAYAVRAKDVVDAGFLELVRYGIREAGDPLIEDSLRVVDAVLKVETPFGPCWRRYNHDGYGNQADGGPYLGWGRGRAWPLLTGERGHYELAAGRDARPYIRAMEGFAHRGGMLPEQVWDEDRSDPAMRLGMPTGAAMPLVWAHSEYIKLVASLAKGEIVERIEPVAVRYLDRRGRDDIEVWKPNRQVDQIAPGHVLRIVAPAAFRLHWSSDDWQTSQDTCAQATGLGLSFVDIQVAAGQRAPIRFTFFWDENADYPFLLRRANTWEGRDYEVRMKAASKDRAQDRAH